MAEKPEIFMPVQNQVPADDAEQWLKMQSIGGPWYVEGVTPEQCFFYPQHTGEDKDPWGYETFQPKYGPYRQQKKLGAALPPIERSPRCPGQMAVPETVSKRYDLTTSDKSPKLYCFAFPGCADAVNAGWVKMELETPDYWEWATYEWPGHGERLEETRFHRIKDLGEDAFDTFREFMTIGQFIIVGHSIGALVASYVTIRAEKELGVKPLQVYILDRTGPHQQVYTPYAEHLRQKEPLKWLSKWNPSVFRAVCDGVKGSQDTADMLISDEGLNVDTLPLGSYKFPCKVFVFIALWLSSKSINAQEYEKLEDPGHREHFAEMRKFHCTGKGYNYDPEEFEEWRKWADDYVIHKAETDHKGVVTHQRFLTVLYREVDNLLKIGKKGGAKPKK